MKQSSLRIESLSFTVEPLLQMEPWMNLKIIPPAEVEYIEKQPSLEEIFLAIINGKEEVK